MFKKRVHLGGATINKYKTVTDWEAVGGAVFVVFVVVMILANT